MAKNNWSSNAFKKAQNLLSPGYNQADTFEAVTTLSKDDANALARSMKLDMGVKGYGNTPFDDNQASIGAYFPNMNEAEIFPLDLDNESSITSRDLSIPTPSKNLLNVNYQNPTVELNAAQKALNALSLALSDGGVKPFKDGKVSGESFYLRDKYNEIFNNGSSNDARDDGKVMASMPQDTADDLTTYMDFIKGEEGFSATPYKLPGEKHNTIGYGHYGTDVQDDLNLTKRQANNILRNDIEIRLDEIQEAIPEFETLPMEVRKNLLGSWFRGSLGGSPKTIKLINEGKFDQAAKEFLNNDEYRTTKLKGVKKRMEATANALRKLK